MIRALCCTFVFAALLAACDERPKQCSEGTGLDLKARISVCGELCDKDDAKACAQQTELAIPACMEKGDQEICRWMCNYSKSGDLFCNKYKELGGDPSLVTK